MTNSSLKITVDIPFYRTVMIESVIKSLGYFSESKLQLNLYIFIGTWFLELKKESSVDDNPYMVYFCGNTEFQRL